MATSGSFSTNSYHGKYLTFNWRRTNYSVAENWTDIEWSIVAHHESGSTWVTARNFRMWYGEGGSYNDSPDWTHLGDMDIQEGTVVGSGTKRLWHYSDGTYNFHPWINATIYQGSGVDHNVEGHQSYTLDTIPRTSNPTVSSGNVNIGDTVTINTNRASASFTHTLWYSVDNVNWTTVAQGFSKASYIFTVPTALAGNYPSGSGTLYMCLRTLSGGTTVGDAYFNIIVNIPVSNPTLAAVGTVVFGSNITVYSNRTITAATHHLYYSFNGGQESFITAFDTEVTWNIPLSLMNNIPNATSGILTFRLYTIVNGNVIGNRIASTEVKVSSGITPSVSISTAEPSGQSHISNFGAYVQNKSKVVISINSSQAYSSPISSVAVTFQGTTYTTSSITANITQAGTLPITVTITDARGRKAYATVNISSLAYTPPAITSFRGERCNSDGTVNDEGNCAKLTMAGSISALGNHNAKSFKLEYKEKTASTWTTVYTYTQYSLNTTRVIANINTDKQYDFRLTASDSFYSGTNAPSVATDVNTIYALMDFNASGKGIAFGQVSTADKFQCHMNAVFAKCETESGADLDTLQTAVNNLLLRVYPVGSIYMSTSSANPRTLFGGTWVAWGTGRVPVGINTSDSNFNTVEKTGGASTVNLQHSHTVNSHAHGMSHSHTVNSHYHQSPFGYDANWYYGHNDFGEDVIGLSKAGWAFAAASSIAANPVRISRTNSASPGTNTGTKTSTDNTAPGTDNKLSTDQSVLQPYITCYMWKRTA